MITVKINNKKYSARLKETVLDVAQRNKIKIPTLCHHPDLDVKVSCRVCVVEVKNFPKLMTACSTMVQADMEIFTDTDKVKKARNLNIELLFASHIERCASCTLRFNCDLLKLAREYKLNITRFPDRKVKRKVYKFANAVEIDGSQCIDCGNCITACQKQGINYLEMKGSGFNQEIKAVKDKSHSCIYCGQCTNVCPVAAAQEQDTWSVVEKELAQKKSMLVAQFAPAVRVSIGEEFGLPYGVNCAKKLNTALTLLGFQNVFDINFGADITTMTEAEELLARLEQKNPILPMFTSCCPAWVAYVEFYHPELIPHLTTARSPHIHSAGAIKSYYAQINKIATKNIKVVSIVPCTAKKYEAARSQLKYKGQALVDYVLTTRELAFLLKKKNINLATLSESETNPLFNDGSGAAAIYGASGGVMESALRSATVLACQSKYPNKLCRSRIDFKEVRGLKGFKSATVLIAGKKLKVGVISGIEHVTKILSKIKDYHYIEVMACPGGCLGGGGQPLPNTIEVRKKRMVGMYDIDSGKTLRRAHENKAMIKYYEWVKANKLESKLLHTSFKSSKV